MTTHRATLQKRKTLPVPVGLAMLVPLFILSACGGSDSSESAVTPPEAKTLACDGTMKAQFRPDAHTKVLLVKQFKKGDALTLSSPAAATAPAAANDLCLVKLLVGPGNPGPAGAPSTSEGIGIEVWLPSLAKWNDRIHVKGSGGWGGGDEGKITSIAGIGSTGFSVGYWSTSDIAAIEGAVSASTDTGHTASSTDGSFIMNPDGSVNTTLWKDFSSRSLHEMAVKTKALTKAFYGRDAKYAYWDGASQGGRQGLKEAQVNPQDFDGVLVGMPAVNYTRMAIGSGLYQRYALLQDLGGKGITAKQYTAASVAATRACDMVGGEHLGYVPDPSQCRYDPTKDTSLLCADSGGANASSDCLSTLQATAINKIWYGQTADGSVPDPAKDNSYGATLAAQQKWYGLARGTNIALLAAPAPIATGAEFIALGLRDATMASLNFRNATGNGANAWTKFSYSDLSKAFDRAIEMQPAFDHINTDNADLSAFRDKGGKMVMYHGLADVLIPAQGTIHYYERVANQMGGVPAVQNFARLYLVPGMNHGFLSGAATADANPPLPTIQQLYTQLTDWVEKGTAPGRFDIRTADGKKSRPLCVYPQRATYVEGSPQQAAAYKCL